MNAGTGRCEVGRAAAGRQQEGPEHEQQHGGDFGDSENVLHQAAELDSEVVDRGQQKDNGGSEAFGPDFLEGGHISDEGQVNRPAGSGDRKLRQLYELGGVLGENVTQGGDRAALYDRKNGPAIKERGERTVHSLEENVLAAGFGNHAGNLGIGQCAKQGDDPGQRPDGEQQFGRADLRGHDARLAENTGADDAAHDDADGGEATEGRDQAGGRGIGFRAGRSVAHGGQMVTWVARVTKWEKLRNPSFKFQSCSSLFSAEWSVCSGKAPWELSTRILTPNST